MTSTLDSFDTLCHQVFLPSNTADEDSLSIPSTSIEETALSLLSRAQIYELQTSMTSNAAGSAQSDKHYYRIHLEELEDKQQQQKVRDVLVQAIDPSLLMILPYDRNLTGYSSKTRTEATEAPLEATVVLDMSGLSSTEPSAESTTLASSSAIAREKDVPTANADSDDTTNKTMLLIPLKEWLRLTGRIRFWRAESHRIKAAQREKVLDSLLEERWGMVALSTTPSTPISSPSLDASPLPPNISATSVPSSSHIPSLPATITRLSAYRQPFQEHQLESLVQFMSVFGDEPSATSLLKGLLDLSRRQLTNANVLSWTFDRANLTEQKPDVTVAFLDLMARLGIELVNSFTPETEVQQQQESSDTHLAVKSPALGATASYSSKSSDSTVSKSATLVQSTDLTWTFGLRIDDRRLEYWIHHLQQGSLPVAKVDHQSLLPSTASFVPTSTAITNSVSGSEQKPNHISPAIRKRFLHDRLTIPAGTIQPLINASNQTHHDTTFAQNTHVATDTNINSNSFVRDPPFVLTSSKYALAASSGSQSSGLFTNRVKKDVKELVRWASSCGGRLDWIWTWLFSSFQRSRHGAKPGHRKAQSNDENV
ncbi:hypothetical protein FBU30_005469 [Linnemannia zychae]|nr:hypothetical protein FBU30_005469 [Linnemannia zychae]